MFTSILRTQRLATFFPAKKGLNALVPGSSCEDVLISGDAQRDGEYWIDPIDSGGPFIVFCDTVTDRGKNIIKTLFFPSVFGVTTSYQGWS